MGGKISINKEEMINRKNFFIKMAKYSATASALFAGTVSLFTNCEFDIKGSTDDNDDDNDATPDYETNAVTLSLESDASVSVSSGGQKSFRVTASSSDYYKIMIGDGSVSGTVRVEIYDDSGVKVYSVYPISASSNYTTDNQLSPGIYYIVISADSSASGSFSLSFASYDYSPWSDAWTNKPWSDAWTNSNWKDIDTGTWVAHSDTWYNGQWSNGWENFAYY